MSEKPKSISELADEWQENGFESVAEKLRELPKDSPPIAAPKCGHVFTDGDRACAVTGVWKSRFGDWKVSYRDLKGGGGCMSLNFYLERFGGGLADKDSASKQP